MSIIVLDCEVDICLVQSELRCCTKENANVQFLKHQEFSTSFMYLMTFSITLAISFQ